VVRGEFIAATSIHLSQRNLKLKISETVQLQAKVSPAKVSDKTVIWRSINEHIASVKVYVTDIKETHPRNN
jgi:uncharacterized protein YjdB